MTALPPYIDPTENVTALVKAAMSRQDDMRNLVADHAREISELRAGYDHRLRDAETARIDAIRAVDVGAVNRAAEVSAAQAQTLAAQVAVSAETLRTQVAAAATAATGAAAESGLALWALGHWVFKGSVPDVVASWVYVLVPGAITFAAGYLARHTPRPDLQTPAAASTPPPQAAAGPGA